MAIKRVIDVEADTRGATDNVEDLNDSLNDTSKSAEKLNDDLKDTSKQADDVGKAAGKSGKEGARGMKALGASIKGIGVAIKAAGIGLIVGLIAQLFEVIKSNQPIADRFSEVFTTISIVFNEVAGAIYSAFQRASEATGGFDALGKVMGGILTLVLTPIKLAFFGLKLGIQEVQLAWEKWVGDADPERIKELEAGILETKQALQDTAVAAVDAGGDIYNNFSEAVGEVSTLAKTSVEEISRVSISAAREQANVLVELRNQAELATAINRGLIEQYDRQAEQLRQIRDEERNGLSERQAANEELGRVLDEQEQKMLANADIAIRLAQAELQRANTIANQVALQDALNEKAAIQAQIEGFRSEQKANELALDREQEQLQRTVTDAQIEADAILREANRTTSQDKVDQLNEQRRIAEENYNVELARVDERLNMLREAGRTETQEFADTQAEKILLQSEYNAEALEIDREYAEYQRELEQKKKQATIDTAQGALTAVSAFLKEGSTAAKGIAIAQATIDTYQSSLAAYKSTVGIPVVGPVLAPIAAATALAAGIAQVRKIVSTRVPGTSGGGGAPSISSNIPSANIQSASVNVTGGNPQLNQIQQSIENNNEKPIETYVVSERVTTQQALDRRVKQLATFG